MRTYLYKLTSDRGGRSLRHRPIARRGPSPHPRDLQARHPPHRATRRSHPRHHQPFPRPKRQLSPRRRHLRRHRPRRPRRPRLFPPGRAPFTHRPDCIYEFHQQLGRAVHTGRSNLHAAEKHLLKDLGTYPYLPQRPHSPRPGFPLLRRRRRSYSRPPAPARAGPPRPSAKATAFTPSAIPNTREADALFRLLWKQPTRYTPAEVDADAYDHAPRKRVTNVRRNRSKPAK